MTVAGRIISTGNGKLVAADGYGQISITNNSDKKLSLSNLSTGGMEGKITIVDSLRDNGLGSSLITEYTRNAGTLTVTNNQGSSSVDNVVSNPQSSYSPESGARFNFMSGQQTVDRETNYRTKTTKRLWGVSAFDVGNDFWAGQAIDNTDTQSLSGEQLLKVITSLLIHLIQVTTPLKLTKLKQNAQWSWMNLALIDVGGAAS